MDHLHRLKALVIIFVILLFCDTGKGKNLTSRHVSGTYSKNLYSHVEVAKESQIQLPLTWDRKNVKLIRKFNYFWSLKAVLLELFTDGIRDCR